MDDTALTDQLLNELLMLSFFAHQSEDMFLDTSPIDVQQTGHEELLKHGIDISSVNRANVESFRTSILKLMNSIPKIRALYPQRDGEFLFETTKLIFTMFDEYYYTKVKHEQWTDSTETPLYRILKELCESQLPLMIQTIDRKYTTTEHKELAFELVSEAFPPDIIEIVNLTYKECLTCYEMQCYLAAISLAGRVIETVLSQLHKMTTGIDPDEKGMGIDAICNGLKNAGFLHIKKDVLKNQLEIVKTHRNKAVHGSIIMPTKEECKAIVLFTKDLLRKLQDFLKNSQHSWKR